MATTFLCLACSSSPSPKPTSSVPFTTACCSRPICERCLSKNPRLRGYNPCLACLAGVAVVHKSRLQESGRSRVIGPSGRSQEQEESIFILGDSDEEDGQRRLGGDQFPESPAYSDERDASTTAGNGEALVADTEVSSKTDESNPSLYYIRPTDTLMGIALRYGIDGHTICKLNSLPLSTLNTNPHLLHTRTSLVLPPTRRPLSPPPHSEARKREVAEKRFQLVTKEVDWRVAKAYISLAEDGDDIAKSKEDLLSIKHDNIPNSLETRAVDHYLDDMEWEVKQGGKCRIQGFPPFAESKCNIQGRKTVNDLLLPDKGIL